MSWQPLCDQDPFPGDPGAVAEAAKAMSSMATKLQEQASLLQGYVSNIGHWQGIAKDAFANKVGTLPSQITTAQVRYGIAAGALAPYGETLLSSQNSAKQLLAQAQAAQQDINRYMGSLHDQQQWEKNEQHRANLAKADPTQGSPTPAQWPGANNAHLLSGAQSTLNGLRSQLRSLQDQFASFASTTAATIGAAAQVDKDNNSLFGKLDHLKTDIQHGAKQFVDYLKDHGIDLAAISGMISQVAGVLSFLAIFPIPGVQEVLAGVAGALTLTALAIDTVLMIAGEKSVKSWAWEAAGALLPMAAHGVGALKLASSAADDVGATATAVNDGKSFLKDYKLVKDAETFKDDMKFMTTVNKVKKVVGLAPSSTYSGIVGGGLPMAIGEQVRYGTAAEKIASKVVALSTAGNTGTVIKYIDGADTAYKVVDTAAKAYEFGQKHLFDSTSGASK